MTVPLVTQLPPPISGIGMQLSMPRPPGTTSLNLHSLATPALGNIFQQDLAGRAQIFLPPPPAQSQYVVAPPSLELGAKIARSIRPPAPPPSGPRALSLVAIRKLPGIPEVSEFKEQEIVDAWMTVVDLVAPRIIEVNPFLGAGGDVVAFPKHKDVEALLAAADADCANTQSDAVKQAAELEAELAAATADTPVLVASASESGSDRLTGMALLKAMADGEKTCCAESSEDQPVTGYAKASVMHRAAENAKVSVHGCSTAEAESQHDLPCSDNHSGGSIYLGNIPKGTSEGLVVSECKKFGTISSIFYDADDLDLLGGGWALVHFVSNECANTAAHRLSRRPGLFGAATPVVVRLSTPDDLALVETRRNSASKGAEMSVQLAHEKTGDGDGAIVLGMEQSRSPSRQRSVAKKNRKRDMKKRKHRNKGRKRSSTTSSTSVRREKRKRRDRRRTRSRDRSRDRKRRSSSSSSSHSTNSKRSKQNPDARRGGLSASKGFDAKASSGAQAGSSTTSLAEMSQNVVITPIEEPSGGRQVSIRGTWAEFSTPDSRTYFVNILTLEKQWHKPAGYDSMASRRPGAPSSGHSNVYVGNLPLGIHEVGFRQLFQPYGNIISIKLMPSRKPGGNDYGFVKYGSVQEAEAAIKLMHGLECNGSRLSVKFAMEDKKY